MSGEAGAQIEGELYSIFVGSGCIVSVAIPPGDDGSAVGRYFEAGAVRYRQWLERARTELDACFAELVQAGTPIVPLKQRSEEIWGTFVEDGDDRNFRKYHKGGPLVVRLDGRQHMPDHRSLQLHFLVSTRVEKQKMQAIAERVAQILTRTEAEPPVSEPPPEVPSPASPPSLWARLFGGRR